MKEGFAVLKDLRKKRRKKGRLESFVLWDEVKEEMGLGLQSLKGSGASHP